MQNWTSLIQGLRSHVVVLHVNIVTCLLRMHHRVVHRRIKLVTIRQELLYIRLICGC